jgi:hypothetical protein
MIRSFGGSEVRQFAAYEDRKIRVSYQGIASAVP